MNHTIQNEWLTVSASERGAELQSVRSADGTEFLWQGDPAYWAKRAPNIFPFVARLWQGCYQMDGKTLQMPIHGFAPTSLFELAERTETSMVFELRCSEEIHAQYPRRFVFRVVYALERNVLGVTYEVQNLDEKPMYFGLGGHPGFNVPLEAGKRFEDYRIRFTDACAPKRVNFSEDHFVADGDVPFALEDGTTLPLRHDLFDDDAIVLHDMAREVVLETETGGKSLKVSFPDMPYLGIWHWPKSDASFVCIEPWSSLPARSGKTTVFEEKKDLIRLDGGKGYINTFTITVGE